MKHHSKSKHHNKSRKKENEFTSKVTLPFKGLSKGVKKTRKGFQQVLNGIVGDKLPQKHPLTIQMSFRLHGEDVSLKELNLEEKLVGPGKNVTVFLHGLILDETSWNSSSKKTPGFGILLERDLEHTTLYLRYNSGLHISQNGQYLSKILEELIDMHGSKINTLTLIGYSMGGLISRSAGYYGKKQNLHWVNYLSTVVLLGVPHGGSHWEQLGHLSSFVLKTIWSFHTRLIGKIIDQRSNGIKDLRLGYMVDEDWQDENAYNLLSFKRKQLEPLPHVQYHVLAGKVSENKTSALHSYFGDGLVSQGSALGKNLFALKNPKTEFGTYKVFPQTNHFQLITSEKVYAYIKDVLRQ